jgi:molybdopterin-binding protein
LRHVAHGERLENGTQREKSAQGKIKEIVRGAVTGEVIVDVGGGQTMTSSISLSSIDRLALKIGDAVVVVVKATDAMIGK